MLTVCLRSIAALALLISTSLPTIASFPEIRAYPQNDFGTKKGYCHTTVGKERPDSTLQNKEPLKPQN